MAITYLSGGRIQGSSTVVGADEEITLLDSGTWSIDAGALTTTNDNNYNGIQILAGSALLGKKVKKIKGYFKRPNSATGGTVKLGVWSGTGSGSTITLVEEHELGGAGAGYSWINSNLTTNSWTAVEVTLTTPRTLLLNDTLALHVDGGNYNGSGGILWQYSDGTNVYDGSATCRNRFTTTWNGGAMTSDMRCVLTCESIVDEKAALVEAEVGSTGWTLSNNSNGGTSTITSSITDAVLTTGGTTSANGTWYGGASYDVGTANISDTSWVLRFKVVVGTIAFGDGNAHHSRIGLAETAPVSTESPSEDTFGLEIKCNSSSNKAYHSYTKDASSGYSYVDTTYDPASDQTVYAEIIRTGSDTGTVKIFSNSDYSTQLGSTASVSGLTNITGFRYIKTWQFSQRPSTQTSAISDIQFWNAQTNTTGDPDLELLKAGSSNLPVGTRFEEIDTRKIFRLKTGGAWVEKGTA